MRNRRRFQSFPAGNLGNRPLLLDLFCGAGGSGKGYWDAGFDVVGVDIKPQRYYPYDFILGDALTIMEKFSRSTITSLKAVHASPPCQAYSDTQRIRSNDHPRYIEATRELVRSWNLPYVIENVPGAKNELESPIMLCGAMFPELRVYRHRYFESNVELSTPPHPPHVHKQVKMGRAPGPGEWVQAVGNFSGVDEARAAMGMPWSNREGLREAIPPAYTEHIGRQLMKEVA